MKSNITKQQRILPILALALVLTGVTNAQQSPLPAPSPDSKQSKDSGNSNSKKSAETTPSSATVGDDAGDYMITSSIEVGARGLRVGGDVNKYRSDLNYHAGARVFDTSFLMRSKTGKQSLVDTVLVTSTGWGADPYGQVRFSAENPKWFRFDGTQRRFKYFRFLNNIANPNWVFSPANFSRPPNPVTGEHGYNTRIQLGDYDLTILPKNERIRFNVGFSPERYSGPAFSNYHIGGNEFFLLTNLRSRANDYRIGADGKVGPVELSFLQGFRRFRDDSFIDSVPPGINANPAVASFNSFNRSEPTRGSVNYTRLSVHTFLLKRLDITGRIIHSHATSNSTYLENFTGLNFNTRVTGQLAPPNVLRLGQYNITGDVSRPDTLGDIAMTFLATEKFRISNTFRVEDFEINGLDSFSDAFLLTRAPNQSSSLVINNLPVNKITKYRRYQDTIEGDYQFNKNYAVHFGYRYTHRRDEQILTGFALNSNAPTPVVPEDEVDTNNTNSFFGGFKARPAKDWTIYFDAEHGTADNVFTRIGNYNYTNIRGKSRYAPNRKLSFNLAVIAKNNSNPSEIAGVSLTDFGVSIKSRTLTSSVDWVPTSRVSISTGYNYNWVNSDAIIDYFFNSIRHPFGHSIYFQRNNFFFIDLVAQLTSRVTLYSSYRVNQDNGQGDRRADPTGTPGTLVTSYPMNFQSPEGRLAIRLTRRVDWNLGYQYYNYNESALVGPRPQNYHAHLPYTSLRVYFGRKE